MATYFELSTLDESTGLIISQLGSRAYEGASVAGGGDINGDGFDDVLVGVHTLGSEGEGRTFVIFGNSDPGGTLCVCNLNGVNGLAVNGIDRGDASGSSVSIAGDINGDGFDDIIIGAIGANPGAFNGDRTGQTFVVFGSSSGFSSSFELSSIDGENGFVFDGVSRYDFSGISVGSGGDVNGDGVDDLIVGAVGAYTAGAAYVVFGNSSGFNESIDPSVLTGANGFTIKGAAPGFGIGRSVEIAGDINGDGLDDILLGAMFADDGAEQNVGGAYIIFGKATGFPTVFDLSNIDGANGFRIIGEQPLDLTGKYVDTADVNGDGFSDLLIASVGELRGAGYGYGSNVYVIYGSSGGFAEELELSNLDSSEGAILSTGITKNGTRSRNGHSISNAGDVNGDGIDDIIVGVKEAIISGQGNVGESYVVFGKSGGFPGFVDLTQLEYPDGFIIAGVNPFDSAGYSVSAAGDVNGDGIDDLLIAAPGEESRKAYIVFGSVTLGFVEPFIPTEGNDTFVGTSADESVDGLGGNDSLVGGRGNDTLVGGAGLDTLDGGPGNDLVSYISETSGVTIDLGLSLTGGAATGDVLFSIELLEGTRFNDVLTGNSDANVIIGDHGADSISGNGGDDTLQGGVGADTIRGGNGFDVVLFTDATSGIEVNLENSIAGGWAAGDLLVNVEHIVGSSHDDSIVGNSSTNILEGNDGNDTLVGGGATASSMDSLYGGMGDDSLSRGGDESTFFSGGPGADTITGGSGRDTASYSNETTPFFINFASGFVDGSATGDVLRSIENIEGSNYDDTLYGDGSPELFVGGDGNDYFDGGPGRDTLDGGAGNDVMVAGEGVDVFWGGSGFDIVDYSLASAGAVVDLFQNFFHGGSAAGDILTDVNGVLGTRFDDSITGTLFDDSLVGNSGSDFLFGNWGADTLHGGLGADTLLGDDGDDTLRGGGGSDSLMGGSGDDSLVGEAGSDYFSGGDGRDTLDGGNGLDTLNGGLGADLLLGGLADDRLLGGDGSDTLDGGNRNDVLLAGQNGNDSIFGGAGDDSLTGGADNDTLDGGGGNDTAGGGSGDDLANGSAGSDIINGGDGFDTVHGDNGDDSLSGAAGNDSVTGGAGEDVLRGNDGMDTVEGGNLNDTLNGGADNDLLDGGNGDDRLVGAHGDDTLIGGRGNDTLFGNLGNDVFVHAPDGGADEISGFQAGAASEDVIDLSGMGAAFDMFTEVFAATSDIDGNAVIDFGGGDQITLIGVAKADLHEDDFVFA